MIVAELDHIVISAATLAAGVAYVEAALGVKMAGGGAHRGLGTHNRLMSLGAGSYLEVIAPNPDDPHPKTARMFDLDNFQGEPRLSNWVLRSKSISEALMVAPEGMGEIRALSRADFRWLMTVPEGGRLPFAGAFPAFIEWQGQHPAPLLPKTGCRLHRLEISHPDAAGLARALAPHLDDERLSIREGGAMSMRATIMTPAGLRVLA